MARVVAVKLLQKPLHKIWALRTRAHNAHIAAENVQKLRQFIQVRFAQESAEGCSSRIFFTRPTSVALLAAAANRHCPELENLEHSAIQPYPVLDKENRAAIRYFYGQRN